MRIQNEAFAVRAQICIAAFATGYAFLTAAVNAQDALAKNSSYVTTKKTGTYLVPPRFDFARSFSEGLAAVLVGDKWGFIDKTGKLVIEPQFNPGQAQFNSYFSDGLAAVNFVNCSEPNLPGVAGNNCRVVVKWGFIDKTGTVVINPQFEGDYYNPPRFSEGFAAIRFEKQYGYIDKTGKVAIEPSFDKAYDFKDGLAKVQVGDKEGFIDRTGKVSISPQYNSVSYNFSEGLASVNIGSKTGYIDKTGKMVIAPTIDFGGEFSEGLARFGSKEYGYIDRAGRVVIKPQFEQTMMIFFMDSFSEGRAVVQFGGDNGKYGFIDSTGHIVINPKFDFAFSFSEGVAEVSIGGKTGYIDKTGKIIIPMIFDEADSFSEGIALVRVGMKYGYIYR